MDPFFSSSSSSNSNPLHHDIHSSLYNTADAKSMYQHDKTTVNRMNVNIGMSASTSSGGLYIPADYAIRMKRIPGMSSSFLVQTKKGNFYFYDEDSNTSSWEPSSLLQKQIETFSAAEIMQLLDFDKFYSVKDMLIKNPNIQEDKSTSSQTSQKPLRVHIGRPAEKPTLDLDEFETDISEYANIEPIVPVQSPSKKAESLPIPILSNAEVEAQFVELLKERKIGPFSLFDLEYSKFSSDPRCLILGSKDIALKLFNDYIKKMMNKSKK